MRQCDRCGEHNHGDARYCGTCGVAMPEAGGIESLVAGGTDPEPDGARDQASDADTAPGVGPGGEGLGTSEYVGAPTFGETGPVTGPSPAPIVTGPIIVAPPSSSPPASDTGWGPVPATSGYPTDVSAPTARPPGGSGIPPTTVQSGVGTADTPPSASAPLTRSSRSTSVMIAALAVAAVVIVGGVFILLSSGSGGDEIARTADEPAASTTDAGLPTPTEPSPVAVPTDTGLTDTDAASTDAAGTDAADTVAPATVVDTVASETVLPDPALPDPGLTTLPPEVVVPPPTAAPIPTPTLPPVPAPTAPPAPTRGPGDLGLAQPILDESCDGRYITFVGSAVGERPYGSVVEQLLGLYPGTNYIWTKACPSLRQEFSTGADIYGVVFGPYATREEACDAVAFGPSDAYVRRISTFDPQDHTIEC